MNADTANTNPMTTISHPKHAYRRTQPRQRNRSAYLISPAVMPKYPQDAFDVKSAYGNVLRIAGCSLRSRIWTNCYSWTYGAEGEMNLLTVELA